MVEKIRYVFETKLFETNLVPKINVNFPIFFADPHQKEDSRDLNIGQERYRILNTKNSKIEKVRSMIYLNKLVIEKATLDDAGMYICFVTNSGFGDLTYKSMTLRVQNRKLIFFFAIKKIG